MLKEDALLNTIFLFMILDPTQISTVACYRTRMRLSFLVDLDLVVQSGSREMRYYWVPVELSGVLLCFGDSQLGTLFTQLVLTQKVISGNDSGVGSFRMF